MSEAVLTTLMFSILIIFCVRHYFVQLIALKLFFDSLTFLLVTLRSGNQDSAPHQASAWILSSLATLSFFVLMAAGVRRFAKAKSLNLEVEND